jgi:hypothetical protein
MGCPVACAVSFSVEPEALVTVVNARTDVTGILKDSKAASRTLPIAVQLYSFSMSLAGRYRKDDT